MVCEKELKIRGLANIKTGPRKVRGPRPRRSDHPFVAPNAPISRPMPPKLRLALRHSDRHSMWGPHRPGEEVRTLGLHAACTCNCIPRLPTFVSYPFRSCQSTLCYPRDHAEQAGWGAGRGAQHEEQRCSRGRETAGGRGALLWTGWWVGEWCLWVAGGQAKGLWHPRGVARAAP